MRRAWIVVLIAASLGAIGAGAALLVRGPAGALPDAKTGRKRPSEFRLPELPGGYEFHSMEAADGGGSSSYSVAGKTPAEIARFYAREMARSGWQLRSQSPTSQQFGEPGEKGAVKMQGLHLAWSTPRAHRQIDMLALANPSGKASQVLLMWTAEQAEGR
jgi:hypothetical protein